jgi:hypothetical protein
LTWFRRHLQARWIDLPPATSKAAVSRMIIGAVK